VGFPHSDKPEESTKAELWAGVVQGVDAKRGEAVKALPDTVKPRKECLANKD